MRKSGVDAKMLQLESLLESVGEGDIALPDFQRGYDWTDSDKQALLVTILSGWPAGSLLLMDAGASFFKVRGFVDAPSPKDSPSYILLDGQQRITTLYQAFYDVGPKVYGIQWQMLDDESFELEDAVVSFPRKIWDERYRKSSSKDARSIIPIYALRTGSDFFEWRDNVFSTLSDEILRDQRKMTSVYRNRIAFVHGYEFPGVVIEKELEPAAIARIFERVNRQGLRLSTFDLMVAKLYEPWWNLRELWIKACSRYERISRWFGEDDGMPALQTISLCYKENVRQAAVLSLEKKLVHEKWDDVLVALDQAVEFLEEVVGVPSIEFMPYRSMIIPISALALSGRLDGNKKIIKEWFWGASFTASLDAAANTRIVNDYKSLLAGDGAEYYRRLVPVRESDVRLATRKNDRARWAAVLCSYYSGMKRRFDESELSSFGFFSDGKAGLKVASCASRDKGSVDAEVPRHLLALGMFLMPNRVRVASYDSDVSGFIGSICESELRAFFEAQLADQLCSLPHRNEPFGDLVAARVRELSDFLVQETNGVVNIESYGDD